MGGEGDDSLKENVTGLDQLKRLRLDLSASDSYDGRNLNSPASPAPEVSRHCGMLSIKKIHQCAASANLQNPC